MNSIKAAYVMLIVTLVLSVVVWASEVISSSENSKDKAITEEFVTCLSAICIDKHTGQQCLEINAKISHIYITQDANVAGAQRIIVDTGNKQCGTSIYK